MYQQDQIYQSASFRMIEKGKWQEFMNFWMKSRQGKEEAQVFGTQLLYLAVEYRAPANLITLIFNLLEHEKGRQMTLDSKLLLKALYDSPKNNSNAYMNHCTRRWEKRERGNVANFLSSKIRSETNSAVLCSWYDSR